MDTPLHSLIPYGTSREPGLILASPEGNIHCWDSLGMGLAGSERAFKTKLEVAQNERITTLTRANVSPRYSLSCTSCQTHTPHTGSNIHYLNLKRPSVPADLDRTCGKTCLDNASICEAEFISFVDTALLAIDLLPITSWYRGRTRIYKCCSPEFLGQCRQFRDQKRRKRHMDSDRFTYPALEHVCRRSVGRARVRPGRFEDHCIGSANKIPSVGSTGRCGTGSRICGLASG